MYVGVTVSVGGTPSGEFFGKSAVTPVSS